MRFSKAWHHDRSDSWDPSEPLSGHGTDDLVRQIFENENGGLETPYVVRITIADLDRDERVYTAEAERGATEGDYPAPTPPRHVTVTTNEYDAAGFLLKSTVEESWQ